MNKEKLLHDVASLPPVVQQEAIDFIAFLKLRYGRQRTFKKTDTLIDSTVISSLKFRKNILLTY